MQRIIPAILLLTSATAAASSATSLQHHSNRQLEQQEIGCDNNEDVVSFDLLLDDRPEETGFKLTCDGIDIWSVQPGSFQERPSEWVTQRTCAPTSVKYCTLTLIDTNGDGLSGDGWYSLDFGATTIGIYDQSAFSTKTYCFGSRCDEVPLEVAEMTQECKPVVLELGLDSNPSETSIKLICDGNVLWNVKQLHTPFDKIQIEECVESYSCCQFSIHDSGNDGLTAGDGNYTGYFGLEADYQEKIRYTGEDGLQFSTISIAFGNDDKCSAAEIVSQVQNASETHGGFGAGALAGSFFGGAIAVALITGLVATIRKSTSLSDVSQRPLVPAVDVDGEGNADDGSKASVGEQLTAWSDAERSA